MPSYSNICAMRVNLIPRKGGGENAGAMPMLIIYAEIYDKRTTAPFPFARSLTQKATSAALRKDVRITLGFQQAFSSQRKTGYKLIQKHFVFQSKIYCIRKILRHTNDRRAITSLSATSKAPGAKPRRSRPCTKRPYPWPPAMFHMV